MCPVGDQERADSRKHLSANTFLKYQQNAITCTIEGKRMNTKRTNLRCFQLMALAMIWMMAAFLRPVNAEAAYVEDDLIIATASQEGSTVRLTWNAVTDADRYQVYGAEYKDGNSAPRMKRIKTQKGRSYTKKDLKTGMNYIFQVIAYDGSERLCKSPQVITYTGERDDEGKAEFVTPEETSVSIQVGKTTDLDVDVETDNGELQDDSINEVRFYSSDKTVAAVNSNGVVRGVSEGSARIYAVAVNGAYAVINVRVGNSSSNPSYTPSQNVKNSYEIQFNANGGTGYTASMTVAVGSTVNLNANGYTRGTSSFSSWNTRADGNGQSYADRASVRNLADPGSVITLYAQWNSTYTVTFNTNGGSYIAPLTLKAGSTVNRPADPIKNGYIFAGWYQNANLTSPYPFGYGITGDTTLYAKWTANINVTVSFQTAGGSNVPSQTVVSGSRISRPSDPYWSGYTFTGWYTDPNVTYGFDFSTPVTSNMTLYAGWRQNQMPGASISAATVEQLYSSYIRRIGGFVDFNINYVEILPKTNDILQLFPNASSNAAFAIVSYNVKPYGDATTSSWSAGDGVVVDGWVVDKSACVYLEFNGSNWVIVSSGTGW